ncbi:MAG: thioredoxin domain-containing protein [Chitinophagaceae bacterium]|nr:thioredoxin domain-containing protein [Chitinophagaceae bacterium]
MMIKAKTVEIIPTKNIWVGSKDAQVSLVEFGDYESEACAKANEVVKKLLKHFEGELKFNFRHFPLTQIHQRAQKAAEAAVGAAQEGKFWEMHNILFEHRKNLGTVSLKLYSREAGISNKKFLDTLVNSTYSWEVRNDLLEGLSKGVRDVPTFFINGQLVEGKPTFENLKNAIETELKPSVKKRA